MLARRLGVFVALASVLLLGAGLLSPASAVMVTATVPDPVANLVVGTVTQGQNQGPDQVWVVPVSWDASATATGYTVSIKNLGQTTTYAAKDVSGTSTTLTTSGLADNNDYLVSVLPKNADGDGTAVTAQFTAIALDRTAPAATYSLNRTTSYLAFADGNFLATPSAAFTLTQTSLSDPSTPVTRKIDLGDGSGQKTWSSGTSYTLTYTKPGVFTPHVTVTDAFGNANTIALPAVHVVNDVTNPVVTIKIPASSNLISSWRVIRGTSTDSGVGVLTSGAVLAQKRGAIWYAYNFHKRVWVKGYTRLAKTLNRKAVPAFMPPTSTGAWHTPRVRGLRSGPLRVEAIAIDGAFNASIAKVDRKIH